MRICDEIHARLTAAFTPTVLQIVDESDQHRGHGGWREEGESHFRVTITSPAFAAMNRIERHRAVHAALGPDLIGRIHALALEISVPGLG
ncbi:MAG: BolA family transcriptional regulator [Rhodobacter sp.]|nr:BolA family transcriptional regulator [Rhodobacter sp.]